MNGVPRRLRRIRLLGGLDWMGNLEKDVPRFTKETMDTGSNVNEKEN